MILLIFNPYLLGHANSYHNKLTHHAGYGYRHCCALECIKRKFLLHVADSQAKWQDGYQKSPESVMPRDF